MSLILPTRRFITPTTPYLVSPVRALGWSAAQTSSVSLNVPAPNLSRPGDMCLVVQYNFGAAATAALPGGFISLASAAATATGIGLRLSYRFLDTAVDGNIFCSGGAGTTGNGGLAFLVRGAQRVAPTALIIARATNATPDPSPAPLPTDHRPLGGAMLVTGFVGWLPGTLTVTETSQNIPAQPGDRLLVATDAARATMAVHCWTMSPNQAGGIYNINPQPWTISSAAANHIAFSIAIAG